MNAQQAGNCAPGGGGGASTEHTPETGSQGLPTEKEETEAQSGPLSGELELGGVES